MYDRGEGLEDTWAGEVVGESSTDRRPTREQKTRVRVSACERVCGSMHIVDGDSQLSGVA